MKPLREREQASVGAVFLVVLALAVLTAFYSDDLPIIGGGTTYTAYFSESAGLVNGNEVRVAGVKVGKVTDVSLVKNQIRVDFEVKDTWVGNQSTASIQIKTLLGEKYLALDPEGTAQQDPNQAIPKSRTLSPFDITDAVNQLSDTVDNINTQQLAQSFEVITNTLKNTPGPLKDALGGLEQLSTTISSRDAQLSQLLSNTSQVSGTLAARDQQFQQLLSDGNLLLTELQDRRDAVSGLLTGTQNLAAQLSGLVTDNQSKLTPALNDLNAVTGILENNQANLEKGLNELAPFARLFTNTVGNGRWFDGYFCGLFPPEILIGTLKINTQGCQPPLTPANLDGSG
ncbi:MAG TPA: MCE family protein [Pseudonocardiaceae bacterium]|jgi:phospholipid/cholesterol/gamma-HCH transport system substrate-binding protein|nr:MCE family protein [Pseudonocardiaceae bacterium]